MAWQMGIDMAAMQKWSNAKVIRYQITGVHEGRVPLADSTKADVSDKVTLIFDWDAKARKPLTPVQIRNEKSAVKNVKADGTKCATPVVRGEYEHMEATQVTVQAGGTIEVKGTRTIPAVADPQWPASCTPKDTEARSESVVEFLAVAEPQILALPLSASQKNLVIAPDRKSYTIRTATNWSWTVMPVVAQ